MLSFRIRGRYITITGFKCPPIGDPEAFLSKVNELAERMKVTMVALDASLLLSWRVLIKAIEAALRAFDEKSNISRKIAIEVMLYLSCSRQINQALSAFGIKRETQEIALILLSHEPNTHRALKEFRKLFPHFRAFDELLIKRNSHHLRRIRDFYGISGAELSASRIKGDEELAVLIEKSLISRMAMVDAYK
mgnify:CR=1 FL=1